MGRIPSPRVPHYFARNVGTIPEQRRQSPRKRGFLWWTIGRPVMIVIRVRWANCDLATGYW